jgi:hypothetical protein
MTEPEMFVDADHPIQKPLEILMHNFTSSSSNTPISVFVGVKDIDRTGDSMWNPKFVGVAIMDEDFKPYTKESQLFF